MFLKSISDKAVASKMNIKEQGLKELYTKDGINKLADNYIKHIQNIYKEAKDLYIEKINKVTTASAENFEDQHEKIRRDLENKLHNAKDTVYWKQRALNSGGAGKSTKADLRRAQARVDEVNEVAYICI